MYKLIKEVVDDELGMAYRMFINDRGHAVGIYDIDANETVCIYQCPDEATAIKKFSEVFK